MALGPMVLLLVAWELAAQVGLANSQAFPPPSRIMTTLIDLARDGFPRGTTVDVHIRATMTRIFAGMGLAIVVGIPVGMFLGSSPLLRAAFDPIITFSRSIAAISLLPLLVAWFGVGEVARILLVTYAALWVVLVNTAAAVVAVDRDLQSAARTLGASESSVFWRVTLMASLPRIFSGVRVALGVSFLVIVAAELVGTSLGLGALIQQSRTFYRSDIALAGMIYIGFIGAILSWGVDWLETRLLPWRVDSESA